MGKLGPFGVDQPIPEGFLFVARCSVVDQHYQQFFRFDPPNGLVFGSHNQTQTGVITFSVQKGSVEDPKKLPTEISCATVAEKIETKTTTATETKTKATTSTFHRPQTNRNHNYNRNPKRMESQGITALNPSQFCFLLVVLSLGVYYLYLVYLHPRLDAASCQRKVKPNAKANAKAKSNSKSKSTSRKIQASDKHQKHRNKEKEKDKEKHRHQIMQSQQHKRKNKGGPSAAKKSGGDKKQQQPLCIKSGADSSTKETKSGELQHLLLLADSDSSTKETKSGGLLTSDSERMEITESSTKERNSSELLIADSERMETVVDDTIERDESAAIATATATAIAPFAMTEKEIQRKVDDTFDATSNSVKEDECSLRVDPLERTSSSSSSTTMIHEKEVLSATEEATNSIANEKGEELSAENDLIPTMAVDSLPTVTVSTDDNSPSQQLDSTNVFVLSIDGMTCGGCVALVNKVVNSFDEIDSVVTDLNTGTSILSCNVQRLNLFPILKALDDVGMQAYLQSQQSLPSAAMAPCPVQEQQIKQQTLGAIGQTGNSTKVLSLMDELRAGSTPLRRYQCSCASDGCICSDSQVHADDDGRDVSLGDICDRLERKLGTSKLEETFRATGGSPELRDKILRLSFPCGCSSEENDTNEE